ncbi:hypothetical protein Ancab_017221 [Ancistrocladus abbreviatus]
MEWRVLVMEYIHGIPILKLGDEIAKRGMNPGGKIAAAAKHCSLCQVALLDYGQVKDLPNNLRLGYANLTLAIADNDPIRAIQSSRLPLATEYLAFCAFG